MRNVGITDPESSVAPGTDNHTWSTAQANAGMLQYAAIGDVRAGSVKRVAAAVGEGAQVVAALHGFAYQACQVRLQRTRWGSCSSKGLINLNAATQRAFFASVPTNVTGLPTLGSPVAQIPDWTMSAVVDYRHKLAEKVVGFINFSYSGQRGGVQDTITAATPAVFSARFRP